MKSLPTSSADAIWVGVGVVGTAIMDMILFDEVVSPAQLATIALIVTGIICLKLSSPS